MADGDMRHGRCGVCGGGEVYQGEYVAQNGLRQRGASVFGSKQVVFDAFVCAACGHVQLHVQLNAKISAHIRNNLDWIPPRRDMG